MIEHAAGDTSLLIHLTLRQLFKVIKDLLNILVSVLPHLLNAFYDNFIKPFRDIFDNRIDPC